MIESSSIARLKLVEQEKSLTDKAIGAKSNPYAAKRDSTKSDTDFMRMLSAAPLSNTD